MESDLKPKYPWRKTWPDNENDFTGFDRSLPGKEDDQQFARMYQHAPGAWRWFVNHEDFLTGQGMEAEPRLAARAAEDFWDSVKSHRAL